MSTSSGKLLVPAAVLSSGGQSRNHLITGSISLWKQIKRVKLIIYLQNFSFAW